MTLFEGEEAGPEGFRQAVQWLVTYFYAYDRILDSPQLDRLQLELDVLMVLFDKVGFCTNIKGVVCETRVGGLHEEYDRDGTLLPGYTVGAGRGPIVCDILRARVSGGTPIGPEWDKLVP